jgi:hypothetical protein
MMTDLATQRRSALLADAERRRLACRAAAAGGVQRPRWADLTVGVGIALLLAMPVLASFSG